MEKITPKRGKIVNTKTLLVTVDIGKATNTGYCRCPDKTEVKPFAFKNNREGFIKFLSMVMEAKKAKGLEGIVVGFESTGAYAEPLIHFLSAKGIDLIQVNPLHTRRIKELNGNSPNKTDWKDPRVIADIIELGHALTVIIPEGAAADLRRLIHARERALQRRTALLNQLQDAVFISFPEFLEVMKDVKTKTAQHLLKNYPLPADVIDCGVEPLGVVLKAVSRGKLGMDRARALYEAARHSVGVRQGRVSLKLEIQAFLAAIEQCDSFTDRLEQEVSLLLGEIPYSRVLLSIKGIGGVIIGGLIGEVGDFKSFHTNAEILKCAGLNLYEISSGRHRGTRHISKRGRALMRKLLFYAAVCTIRKDGIMRCHYERYLRNGMNKMKAVIAISRKLLCIMFAMVRDHNNYIENYNKAAYLEAA
jgi:transposase